MKIKQIQKLVEKKEREITKLLINYCEAKIKETEKEKRKKGGETKSPPR